MKRPFETVRESIYELIQNHKVQARQLIEQIDGLMIWIVGFSIGGLSLIVSDLAKFNDSFSHLILKSVLVLLCLSIISGIVFRISCYFIQIYNNQINVFIETSFSDKEFMAFEPQNLSSENSIHEVIRRLDVDFGETSEQILNAYSNVDLSNVSAQEALLDDLKQHYHKIGEWAKRDYELATEFAKDTMQKAYGYSTSQIEKIAKDNTSAKWQFWIWTAYISFAISCLGFISVIITLCVTY